MQPYKLLLDHSDFTGGTEVTDLWHHRSASPPPAAAPALRGYQPQHIAALPQPTHALNRFSLKELKTSLLQSFYCQNYDRLLLGSQPKQDNVAIHTARRWLRVSSMTQTADSRHEGTDEVPRVTATLC